jgi:hypothetical protein
MSHLPGIAMKNAGVIAVVAALGAQLVPILAQESKPATTPPSTDTWTRTISQRSERGTLNEQREIVRGDSGKWNDQPRLQHIPSLQRKPSGNSLDDWADTQAAEKEQQRTTTTDDNWLVLRTQQLDDNDRVWVERIERRGNEFEIVLYHAVWRGKYFKNFTFYQVEAVNLGKLPPGNYTAKWIIQPMDFTRYEDPGQPKDNWPKDERLSSAKPTELTTAFTVVATAAK